jgi:hypothetical protein
MSCPFFVDLSHHLIDLQKKVAVFDVKIQAYGLDSIETIPL